MSLRIAFVGTAHIHTPGFLNALKEREATLVGIWDHDAPRAAANSEKTGAPMMALDDLLSQPNLDGIIICSETNRHPELVEAAVQLGKPVFVEKPMGASGRDSRKIAKLFEESGCVFQTGYFSRGMPQTQTLRKLLAEKAFGNVTRVRMSNCHSGALGGWFDTDWRWMADREQSGVGAFGDLGTHVLDLMLWCFGEVEAVTGTLSMGTARYEGCDEYGEAIIKFKSGVIGTLAAGWNDVADPVRVQVCGTEGHFIWGSEVKVAGADGKFVEAELEPGIPAGLNSFLDHLEGKHAELLTAAEAAERDRVMSAIYEAAEDSKWVKL
jgi:predicted dehydrogenase